jgi:hypothetical protein
MSTLDDQIRTLFDKLNARKAKVAELESQLAKSWTTNCSYRLLGSTTPVSLGTSTASQVLDVVADLMIQRKAREEAAMLLELDPPKSYQGYTFNSWVEDSKKRLAGITIREEKKALDELEDRLNTVLSPDERRRIEVERLMASL